MLEKARRFFSSKNILEVDPPALLSKPQIDANIDVITAQISDTETAYLHTSPEYSMKKLLSQGAKDIYYLGHVYRKEEKGRLHNPEFTMAEWYRLSITLEQMIEETCDFLFLFLKPTKTRILTFRDAFQKYANINYSQNDLSSLLPHDSHQWSRQESLHYILAHYIEPKLGQNELTILTQYPPNEAALARTTIPDKEEVASRFEVYHQGVELANGYHELTDANELRRRFNLENEARSQRGQTPLPIDNVFLSTVENLPDCCGVSVGFDRAFMLQQNGKTLSSILKHHS